MVSLPLWMPFSGCAALFKQERAASRLKKKQPKLKNLYFHGFTFRLLSVCINGLILIWCFSTLPEHSEHFYTTCLIHTHSYKCFFCALSI